MKEKLFKNVNDKLKKAACILAIGGLSLVAVLGAFAVYTTWQYTRNAGFSGSSSMLYTFTTLITYAAMGFGVLISAWALYSFAELAEDTKIIKSAFCDDCEDLEWVEEEGEETCSCGCDCESENCENSENDATEENK